MTSSQAHELLDAACEGANVSKQTITRCLQATGDLAGVSSFSPRHDGFTDTAKDLHKRLLRAARKMLHGEGVGHVDDAFAIQWAETMLRQNVEPRRHVEFDDDLSEELRA